jgi:dTDP-4-dehydrorhamnose 3,5-epimerase
VISEWAEFSYKTSNYYAPLWERTLLWSDPVVGINWPFLDGIPMIIASKDTQGRTLDQAEIYD